MTDEQIDVIKEFAERLKEQSYIPNLSCTGEYIVDVSDIDNLVKELTHQPTKIEHSSLCETETYESR